MKTLIATLTGIAALLLFQTASATIAKTATLAFDAPSDWQITSLATPTADKCSPVGMASAIKADLNGGKEVSNCTATKGSNNQTASWTTMATLAGPNNGSCVFNIAVTCTIQTQNIGVVTEPFFSSCKGAAQQSNSANSSCGLTVQGFQNSSDTDVIAELLPPPPNP